MKVKIVIVTASVEGGEYTGMRRSEVWNGELDILDDQEYLVKMSVIGEGMEHPIVDIPFATGIGHWHWIPDRDFINYPDIGQTEGTENASSAY